MTAKKAAKKKAAPKKAAKKTSPCDGVTIWDLKLRGNGKATPDLDEVEHGDLIRVKGENQRKCYEVTVTVKEIDCKLGIGGGPIIIHS